MYSNPVINSAYTLSLRIFQRNSYLFELMFHFRISDSLTVQNNAFTLLRSHSAFTLLLKINQLQKYQYFLLHFLIFHFIWMGEIKSQKSQKSQIYTYIALLFISYIFSMFFLNKILNIQYCHKRMSRWNAVIACNLYNHGLLNYMKLLR